jgi:hypothetical protein
MPTLAVFQLLVCRGVLRVLKKFLSRWRIFGSKWRLDMPQESERGVSYVPVAKQRKKNSLLQVYSVFAMALPVDSNFVAF